MNNLFIRRIKFFPCNKKCKDIYYNNLLTSSHYLIERRLKRDADEQIQHWLLLLRYHIMSCDHVMNNEYKHNCSRIKRHIYIYTYYTLLHNYIKLIEK